MTDSERISDLECQASLLASDMLVLEAQIADMEKRFNALVSEAAKAAIEEAIKTNSRQAHQLR